MFLHRGTRHPLNHLRDEMDRLVTEFFPPVARAASVLVNGRSFPPVNVWEEGDYLLAEAELPGLKSENIDIAVVGNELTIKGERPPVENKDETFHRRERGEGAFTRVIHLPVEVDAEKVTAKLENGVLLITLPKAEAAKPRKIQVASN